MVDGDRISELTATTQVELEDIVPITQDPSGTPITKGAPVSQIQERFLDFSPPTVDLTGKGLKTTLTAGAALAFGNVVRMGSDSKMELADADALATANAIAIVLDTTIDEDDTGRFLLLGFVRDDSWAFTPGAKIYLSTTAGGFTETPPSGTDDVVQILGFAYSADIIFFKPELVQVEIA